MKIVIIGAGFVGLTHAAVCAELGHQVVAYDVDKERIAAYASGARQAIERHVNEAGVAACVARHLGRGLRFTADPAVLAGALGAAGASPGAEAVFLCVATPPQHSGATDRRFYVAAVTQVVALLARRRGIGRVAVVNKSTVPIGTTRHLAQLLRERGVRNAGAVSNPEFLPQGDALNAALRPDRVVVGADGEADFEILRRVYARVASPGPGTPGATPYIETTPETSEAIKYVSNALLFTYVSFWNGVGARLGERMPGVHLDDLRAGVTSDARISDWGARVGIGAGGSCFGKDICSLIHQLESVASPAELLQAVYRANELQKVYLIERAAREVPFDFEGKTVAVLGLAFKQNTNDMRDSAALRVIEALLARGVVAVRAHDPMVDAPSARRWLDPARDPMLERVSHHGSVAEALQGSHAALVATDWDAYRHLDGLLHEVVSPPYLVIDGRRMLAEPDRLVARGFTYLPVGGPLLGREHMRDARAGDQPGSGERDERDGGQRQGPRWRRSVPGG